jgi:hypothetical protein
MLRGAGLDEERGANRENRRIIVGLTQRIPELEPARDPDSPQELRESPETATVEPDRGEPRSATGGQQEPAQEERSWWRRMFGA